MRSEVLVKEGNNDIALSWYPASENGKKVADAKTFAALNTKEVTRSYEQPDGSTVTVNITPMQMVILRALHIMIRMVIV